MRKKLIHIISLALCIAVLSVSLSGCGQKSKVDKLISDFEAACQSANVEKILGCCDPNVIEPLLSVMGLFGADAETLSGIVYAAIGTGILASLDAGDTSGVDALLDFLGSISIKATNYKFNDSKDRCEVTVIYTRNVQGESRSDDGTLSCVLREGEWYLAVY